MTEHQAKILLFHMNNDRLRSIERICRSLSIRVSVIKPSSYQQSLGYLAGISGFQRKNSNASGRDLEAEMLVFSGLDPDQVDAFLDAFKKAGLPPVALKAILTPTNIFWTPLMLCTELMKERNSMLHN